MAGHCHGTLIVHEYHHKIGPVGDNKQGKRQRETCIYIAGNRESTTPTAPHLCHLMTMKTIRLQVVT